MRRAIIAGNWKMNNTIEEGLKFVEEFKPLVVDSEVDVVLCVPFTTLSEVSKALKATKIKLGAQNMHFEDKGAFTGEISPAMLKELGVEFVTIGHSERREYFNETDETVNKKVRKAIEVGITPILCCGETLEQREGNKTEEIIGAQITKDLCCVDGTDVENMVIAYEPIWAIGTGKTATDQQAQDTIKFIRTTIASLYCESVAEKVRIQYGGSVKPNTIAAQMKMADIDGALVGGASLVAKDFAAIVKF